MGSHLHPTRHDHPASTPLAHDDATVWDAFFPRISVDEQASALARDDHAAHSDADEFTARAVPVGLQPGAIPLSRLTTYRDPRARRSA